jgi:hypothetical protein
MDIYFSVNCAVHKALPPPGSLTLVPVLRLDSLEYVKGYALNDPVGWATGSW